MLTSLKGGFFFFFAACIVCMGVAVWLFVPETKGRTLEEMDGVFGSAYGGEVEGELREFRRERERGGLVVVGDNKGGIGAGVEVVEPVTVGEGVNRELDFTQV